jgi:outer membrane murein-binding lipoprotein Lpp
MSAHDVNNNLQNGGEGKGSGPRQTTGKRRQTHKAQRKGKILQEAAAGDVQKLQGEADAYKQTAREAHQELQATQRELAQATKKLDEQARIRHDALGEIVAGNVNKRKQFRVSWRETLGGVDQYQFWIGAIIKIASLGWLWKTVLPIIVAVQVMYAVTFVWWWGIVWGAYAYGAQLTVWGLFIALCLSMCRVTHKYKYNSFGEETANPVVDLRADKISLGELKHLSPDVCSVKYTKRFGGVVFHSENIDVSFEMLSQITTADAMSLHGDDVMARDRLYNAAKSLHSVNVDRYGGLVNEFVVQNTVLVAFGQYKSMRGRLDRLPFCRT